MQEPAKTYVLKLETQFRIRLSKEVADDVSWLQKAGNSTDNSSISCFATFGPFKQLHLLPNRDEPYFKKIREALTTLPAKATEIAELWMEGVRDFAAAWPVVCSFESKAKRFTIVLPKEARDLGIIPPETETLVVLVAGEIFEIWPSDKWTEHIIKIRSVRNSHVNPGLDSLESRDVS
jgi:hypothetical protein